MNELIEIDYRMNAAERKKARAHNRKIAYAKLEEEYRGLPEMSEEEEKRGKQYLLELLRKEFPDFQFSD